MHGKKGEGRFKGFSLGNLLLWESKTKTSSHVIKLNIKDPQNLDVEKKDVTELAEYETGTIFRAFPNGKRLNFQIPKGRKIDLEKIINDITSSLEGSFLTVLQDKNISLTLNNKKLSVSNYIEQQTDNKLPEPNSDVTVKTIIWNKSSVDNNRIFWCDIIDSNESSLAKLKECLDADIGPEDGTTYLMKKHGDILSKNTK